MDIVLGAIGATAGMFVVVNVFRMIAGVKFTSWRHVLSAYLAAAIAATFIAATGAADGGPPNFTTAPVQWIGAFIAAGVEILRIRGASSTAN